MTVSDHRNIKIAHKVLIGDRVNIQCAPKAQISLGDHVKIGSGCTLNSSGNNKITIGTGTSLHGNCVINGNVSIGNWCLFAANIFLSSHPHTFKSNPPMMIRDQDLQFFDINNPSNHIIIEDDCWIGWGVVIREGIRVGKGSIIGANSVVVKDVPPYSIVGGIPGKVLKNRLELSQLKEISGGKVEDRIYFWNGFRTREQEVSGDGVLLEKAGKIMLYLKSDSTLKIHLTSNSAQSLKVSVDEFQFSHSFNLKNGENNLEIRLSSSSGTTSSQWLNLESVFKNSVSIKAVQVL